MAFNLLVILSKMRGLSGSLIVLEKQGKIADNNWPKNTIIINNIKHLRDIIIITIIIS
jgi:hypothetical protein